MAGMFGFMNFEKEGPGISKNAPKKKPFILFFETYFRNFWKFIPINIIYILLLLPVVSSGLSNAGLTHVTRNIARDKHSFGLSDFFETIRKNSKQGLTVGIINFVVTALIIYGVWFYNELNLQTQSVLSFAGLSLCFLFLAIFNTMKYYIYTLMITFKYKVKTLYINSFKFVFLNLWRNLLCGIIMILVYGIYIAIFMLAPYTIVLLAEIFIAILTFPAFKFLLVQFCTFGSIKKHIIDPYYKANPDADIEIRRNLGIDVPEDEECEEVMSD